MIKNIHRGFLYYTKELLSRIKTHHIESFSSQIAFFMLLSVFPFLIILFMIITNLSVSYADQMETIYRMIPTDAADIIKDYLTYSQSIVSSGALSPILIVSIWLSSNAMTALMKAFNIAYNVTETRGFWHRKLISIVCTLMTAILIVSALIIPNVGRVFMDFIKQYIEVPDINLVIINRVNNMIVAIVFVFVLGALYFILPNKNIRIYDVVPGTVFSVISLFIISYLFSYFVSDFSQYSLVYGGLAAVIIFMIWLFLCGIILMLGGEINSIKIEKMDNN